MNSPILAAVALVCALLVIGCGDKIGACNDAKLQAGKSWSGEETMEKVRGSLGEPSDPRCIAAAHRAAEAASKSPVEAKQAADAAALACPKVGIAKSDAERAWTLCGSLEH